MEFENRQGMGNSSFLFGDATETARKAFPEVRELGLQVSQPLGPLGGHYQERRDAPHTPYSPPQISTRKPELLGRQNVLCLLQTQVKAVLPMAPQQECVCL